MPRGVAGPWLAGWLAASSLLGACALSPRAPAEQSRALAAGFELPAHTGGTVALTQLLAPGRPVVLVFYRGHW